jgi:hypothetical protein
MIKKFTKNSERGQAIILIAFAIIGMIAIVGLMTDGGILLIEYARLKRGIDAASVAAAQQFRKGYAVADLEKAGEEFLKLNQSDVATVEIETCTTATIPNDPILCTTPSRKLVRVTASRVVNFGFMRVIGFNSTTIEASSVGEAASIDLVMVIDTSSSMAYETTGSSTVPDPGDDPAACNNRAVSTYDGYCQPMADVKDDAKAFIASDLLFFPYDRVGIVTMTSQNVNGFRNPETKLALSPDPNAINTTIDDITVYEPPPCDSLYGSCRNVCTTTKINDANAMAAGVDLNGNSDYSDPGDIPPDDSHPCNGRPLNYYLGQECPVFRMFGDPSSCGSSNVGGAINEAYGLFGDRQDSFWVIIALVGGPPNSTNGSDNLADNAAPFGLVDDSFAFGFCPTSTWVSSTNPFCRDGSASTRHAIGSTDYDADDYARDIADRVVNPTTGGVTIFTIGLGDLIRGKVDTDNSAIKGDDDAAEKLLQYIARNAGDTYDPITGTVTGTANHGEYYFAPDASGLTSIFNAIAKNIFTRISH